MNPDFVLRPYQTRYIEAIHTAFKEVRRTLAILPGGGGKTICVSALAEQYQPRKTLILADTDELIQQACDKLYRSTGITAGLEKASSRAEDYDPVVVSSFQTMSRTDRLTRWNPNHFGLVVADEAHIVCAPSYRKVLDHFTGAHILGITATGFRSDNRQLKDVFDSIAIEISLKELVLDGYLAPIKVQTLPINIDLTSVAQSQGDFDKNDLDGVITPHLKAIAEGIKTYAPDRPTLVCVPLIKTSEAFVVECNKIGLVARHIDGKSDDRRQILADFTNRRFQVLCNSMLLNKGYDEPIISCVVMARPTRSRVLYNQFVLRGTRIHPSKQDLLILDPLFMSSRFSLVNAASLICTNDQQQDAMTKKMRKPGEPRDLLDMESDVAREREEALKREIERNKKRIASSFNPLDFATTVHNMEIADYEPTMAWETQKPSDKQIALLAKWKFDPATITSKGLASKILDTCFKRMESGLATPGQLYWLRRMGHPSPETASKEAAGQFLDLKWGKKQNA